MQDNTAARCSSLKMVENVKMGSDPVSAERRHHHGMDETALRILGRNVKRLRTAAGLSQSALGLRAGMAQSAISYIERGGGSDEKAATLDTLTRLAEALKVPTWTLLIETDDASAERLASLDKLVNAYTRLPSSGQDQVDRVADAEARYAKSA